MQWELNYRAVVKPTDSRLLQASLSARATVTTGTSTDTTDDDDDTTPPPTRSGDEVDDPHDQAGASNEPMQSDDERLAIEQLIRLGQGGKHSGAEVPELTWAAAV